MDRVPTQRGSRLQFSHQAKEATIERQGDRVVYGEAIPEVRKDDDVEGARHSCRRHDGAQSFLGEQLDADTRP